MGNSAIHCFELRFIFFFCRILTALSKFFSWFLSPQSLGVWFSTRIRKRGFNWSNEENLLIPRENLLSSDITGRKRPERGKGE
jgi:hypothetical protein